jgi:hypothetical protein
LETLGFAGKMRKSHAETTEPSGKYGLKGLSLAEIAGELDCSKAAVVGLLHRGLQKLRTLLEEESRG